MPAFTSSRMHSCFSCSAFATPFPCVLHSTEGKFKNSDDVAFYRCVERRNVRLITPEKGAPGAAARVCFPSAITAVVPEYRLFSRRQSRGPSRQHRALLDTLVLTEVGARLELLEPDTEVAFMTGS